MAVVTRFPGTACRHYARGRCLYPEALNPGYAEEHRCRVLAFWEAAYEGFLRQAEAFDLSAEQAAQMWRQRFASLDAAETVCADYAFAEGGGSLECAFARGDICLLALPRCGGVCRFFEALEPSRGEDR